MSSVTRPSALPAVLEDIAAQLDGTTGIVKIPFNLYILLDPEEQIAAARCASLNLGQSVKYYLDSTNLNRVYLANLASIQIYRPCEAWVVPGYSMPVLFPGMSRLVEQPNQSPRVDIQQPSPSQSFEAPQFQPSTSRIRRKRVTRTPDAFTAFSAHQYQFMKQKNPEMTKTDICAIIKAKWAKMDEEERKPYSELAESQQTD
ncbi:hypothetical protein FHL15_009872 [Xylaria flabelliformis]|uniref:HMG box domain-containing protein n=1 Tax=Xylaria flabelliformis TaxID=2512241 RepID=A0A553HMI8_9PEZI|nr:hypothetical protein FHL15_009872 [Xylaria flabelliformis]